MAWKDQLGRVTFAGGRELIGASFRGVPFHVESAELGGGRRTVAHEFPLRDQPFIEDMGRKGRFFPVDAYVLGENYLTYRGALIEALEAAGPGELAHPYYGSVQVICSGFRVRESTGEGGLARFSIDFEETEARPAFPVASVESAATVEAAAVVAQEAVSAEFLEVFDVELQPASALASLAAVVADAAQAITDAMAPFIDGAQELASLKRDLDNLAVAASALVRLPFELVGAVVGTLESLATMPLLPDLGVRALLGAAGFPLSEPRPPDTTATRVQERANYDAVLQLVRSLIVVQAARLAPGETYDTYEAAAAMRDAIGEQLDALAETSGDAGFAALSQLRADLVRALPGEASDLPRLVRYTPASTLPSLVLAHQLYGDVSREADLVLRNRVQHPGFVQGGTELEVLTRVS